MDKEYIDSCWDELAVAVVLRAVMDWKNIANGTAGQNRLRNLSELRRFFQNDCYGMLMGTDIEADKLLEELEKYLEQRTRAR